MTKDEARTILAMMASDRHEAEADALLMAIDALSEPSGDLISRADAIDAVTDIQDGSGQRYYLAVSLVDKIRSLPSAVCDDCIWTVCNYNKVDWDTPSAEAEQGYTQWLEKIIVDAETFEWLCEDTNDKEWCEENCHYSSIQAECLRHLYEVNKGGDTE